MPKKFKPVNLSVGRNSSTEEKIISWKMHFSQTVLGSKLSYQANDNEEITLLIL